MTWYYIFYEEKKYLENPHEEGHRRSYQDSLLIRHQAFKSSDVGMDSILWYQAVHHSSHH